MRSGRKWSVASARPIKHSRYKEAARDCGGRYGISIDFGLEVFGRKSILRGRF
jgi:hypothetical protein